MQHMDSVVDPPGAAHLVLADAVVHLDPEQAVFEAMLAGWQRQQRTRFLSESGTIGPRVAVVRRMAEFANSYPWQWEPSDGEDFITYLRSQTRARPIVVSTARSYEMAIALFVEYVTDRRYGWRAVCEQRFSQVPQRIFHEGNTIAHVADVEGQPGRRPLTYDEVQALFDAADARVEQIRGRGRKGALTALRDAALLKTVYAYGLRRREVHGLDLADRRHSPAAAQYGRYGAWFVRWGKASKGSPPKRRTVLTVPEMDWIVEVLEHWVTEVRPLLRPGPLAAVWVSERAGRMSMRSINEGVRRGPADGRVAGQAGPALSASFLCHPSDRVRLPRAVRLRAGRAPLRVDHGALHRGFGRVPASADPPRPAQPYRTVGATPMIRKMGYRWNLRKRMAEQDMFATTDLVPLLADRGIHLSREQVYRLVTAPPQRLSMDTLAALCDILACTPNDLIEIDVVNTPVAKTGGPAERIVPPQARRTTIRRPRAT